MLIIVLVWVFWKGDVMIGMMFKWFIRGNVWEKMEREFENFGRVIRLWCRFDYCGEERERSKVLDCNIVLRRF